MFALNRKIDVTILHRNLTFIFMFCITKNAFLSNVTKITQPHQRILSSDVISSISCNIKVRKWIFSFFKDKIQNHGVWKGKFFLGFEPTKRRWKYGNSIPKLLCTMPRYFSVICARSTCFFCRDLGIFFLVGIFIEAFLEGKQNG